MAELLDGASIPTKACTYSEKRGHTSRGEL